MIQAPLRQTWLTRAPSERVTQRHVSAGTPPHGSPLFPAPRCPLRQSAHEAQVSPVSHVPSPHTGPQEGQPAHADHAPHVQAAPQLRARVSFPPQPVVQARVPVSVAPAMHSPSPTQVKGPSVQSGWQRRSWRPHIPQAEPISMSPGEQGP